MDSVRVLHLHLLLSIRIWYPPTWPEAASQSICTCCSCSWPIQSSCRYRDKPWSRSSPMPRLLSTRPSVRENASFWKSGSTTPHLLSEPLSLTSEPTVLVLLLRSSDGTHQAECQEPAGLFKSMPGCWTWRQEDESKLWLWIPPAISRCSWCYKRAPITIT